MGDKALVYAWMGSEEDADRGGGAVEVKDAYITYVRQSHGYLRSRAKGMGKFEMSSVVWGGAQKGDWGGGVEAQLSPGLAVRALLVPLAADEDIHQPTWQARAVVPLPPPHFPADITHGSGRLVLAKKTYGILAAQNSAKVFVPGWAGVNNAAGLGWQVPELGSAVLHYLAMPNPKTEYKGEPFALSLHPLTPACDVSSLLPDPAHWAKSHLPQSPPTASTTQPRAPAVNLTSYTSVNWVRVRAALRTSTLLPVPEFAEILNGAPNLYHWAFFAAPDLPQPDPLPPLDILSNELSVLSQARLL